MPSDGLPIARELEMSKSKSPARISAPTVPEFSNTLRTITKTVLAFESKVDSIRERMTESISAAFEGYRTSLINMDVPKTPEGRKAILAAIGRAKKESIEFANLVGSGMFKAKTLSHYTTGLILCYMHSRPFFASAGNAVNDGGLPRPYWWPIPKAEALAARPARDGDDGDDEPVGSKGRKPSEVVTVTAEGMCLLGTHFCGMVRRLHGDRVADDLVDAIVDTVPNFKIRAE